MPSIRGDIMAKTTYPIKKEFFPFNHLTFPINRTFIALAQRGMRTPGFLFRDPEVSVERRMIPGYEGGEFEILILTPMGLETPAPCFVDIHGGGFVFDAATNHYRYALEYAKGAGCVVVFVKYRLAPKFPYPVPQEDSYAALTWVFEHAEELGIDSARIGIGGDSAGGTLAVTSCLLARERGHAVQPLFQLLIYPFLDDRNQSESYKRFTDTPMWSSGNSRKVGPLINPHPEEVPLILRSPIEADSFAKMPPAYIEVAQFDALHDDGVLYAELLRAEDIEVELHETVGTMHGFDSKVSAPTSKAMVAKRIAYMKRQFER